MILKSLSTSVRRLRRQPALAAAAAFTLAIGIGAVVAGFSVLKGVVLDPLPYLDADRLVHVFRHQPPVDAGPVSRRGFLQMQRDASIDIAFAGYAYGSATLADDVNAQRIVAAEVSRGFFDTLGLEPVLGRNLAAIDQQPDAPAAVVISHRLWQNRYAGAADVLGETIRLNGKLHTIVGVADPRLDIPRDADAWQPAQFAARGGNGNYIMLFARLGSGTTKAQLKAWADRFAARWAAEDPASYSGLEFRIEKFSDWMTRGIDSLLWAVFAAVSLVLLIACANVTNLMLTQTLARSREIATHAALGARRSHIGTAALGEALLIAMLGLAGGLLLASLGVHFFRELAATYMPRVESVSIDAGVVAFALGLAFITALLCGLLPVAFARRINIAGSLQASSKQGTGGGSQHWRRTLVIGEMAMSMVLVVSALLLVSTIRNLSHVDPGFDTSKLLTAQVMLAPDAESETWEEYMAQQDRFLDALRAKIATLPGVESFGAIDTLPVTGRNNWNGQVRVAGQEYPDGQGPTVEFRWVDHGYFQALGLPLLQGRTFSENETGPPRVMVNQAFVDEVLAGGEVLGRRLSAMGENAEIIGVVGNARQWNLRREADPEIYFPYGQMRGPYSISLALRTSGEPLALAPQLRAAVQAVNADVPVYNVRSMAEIVERSYALQDFFMNVLLAFGVAALLIAAVGLYAVLAYAVSQRTRDIGVQLALGASAARVLRDTLREGVLLAIAGIFVGGGLAVLVAKMLAATVFGVSVYEPLVYGGAGLVLGLTALAASLLPAWRASRVEPVTALRYE